MLRARGEERTEDVLGSEIWYLVQNSVAIKIWILGHL